ncbi:MAG: ABC transporter permease, partial [Gemmatimonadaceae bacterium]
MIDSSTLRIAARTLGRHRGFTLVAILSLGVAIALNTTMYSVMDALLDPQIPAREPGKIYTLRYFGDVRRQLHPTAIEDALREGAQGFEAVTGANTYRFEGRSLAEAEGRYARIDSYVVRWNFFDFLGTPAIAGRTFTARDDGTNNIVISDRLAGRLFDDRSPIGRTVLLGGNGHVVIGVVERSPAISLLANDVWMLRASEMPLVPLTHIRFRDEIDRKEINERVKVVANRLAMAAGEAPGSTAFRGAGSVMRPFRVAGFHFALAGAVFAVLMVACANLANLQLARGLARSRELALRSAVGAARRQLVGHLLLETGLLAVSGLALGVLLTLWGMQIVEATIPDELDGFLVAPQPSWGMFVFAAGAALVCLFLVGLLPSLRVSRVDPNTLLKSGAGTGANKEHRRRYGMMVVAQIGFSLPVLIGAILLIKSGLRYRSHDYLVKERYGYDPRPVVVGSVSFMPPRGARKVMVADIASRVAALVKTVPGVLDVAAETYGSAEGPRPKTILVDDENGVVRAEPAQSWSYSIVSPSYFRVYGNSAAKGRDFGESEFDGEAIIVDAQTAIYLWGRHD